MTWKFPGTGRVGQGISTTLEDMGLWDERERIAKQLYSKHTANDPVMHCNRFPAWDELTEKDRKPWRAKAHEQMKGATK